MLGLGLPAAAAAVAAATAAAAVALFGLGHVDADRASIEIGAVEGRDSLVGRIVILEGHKTKTARAAGVPIADHDRFTDFAMDAERVPQCVIICSPAQTSNKQFLRHFFPISVSAAVLWSARLANRGGPCVRLYRSRPRWPATRQTP